jgi:pimeloyl-ACP methyl ester carboxylesterase
MHRVGRAIAHPAVNERAAAGRGRQTVGKVTPHREAAQAFVQKHDRWRVVGRRSDPAVFQVLSEDFEPRRAASYRAGFRHLVASPVAAGCDEESSRLLGLRTATSRTGDEPFGGDNGTLVCAPTDLACVVRSRDLEEKELSFPPDDAPTIVFLHEGLGCLAMWRDFPDRMASATGCGALVYSRMGYGASEPVRGPWPVRFMHDEALDVLPAVIERFKLKEVVLFGHSDGASIAVIYTAARPRGLGGPQGPPLRRSPIRALVLESPHVFVEPICIESITRIARAYETTRLRERLAQYHGGNTDSMFRTWTDVWLRPEFREWNIEEYLPAIESPVLVVQGEDDEYGTVRQIDAVVTQVSGPAKSLVLARCGHSPLSDQPDEVLEAASRFVRQTLDLGH